MTTSHHPRVVSLVPCGTEIVCALGFKEHLVGRSHECDFPESVKRLPVCTAPNFTVAGGSHEIDAQMQDLLRAALSVYRVDTLTMAPLQPDIIVTQAQCEVCAASLADVEQALGHFVTSQPHVISLQPKSLTDLWKDIASVADSLGAPVRAEQLNAQLQQRIAAIVSRVDALAIRPNVACIEWIDPLMAAGNWIPELVEIAGACSAFGSAGEHSAWLSWEELCGEDPEIIIIMPCGLAIARSRQDMPILTRRPEWSQLRAVMNGRVYVTDGNQYFNRPGPRLVAPLEVLAEIVRPEIFRFGHENHGWQLF